MVIYLNFKRTHSISTSLKTDILAKSRNISVSRNKIIDYGYGHSLAHKQLFDRRDLNRSKWAPDARVSNARMLMREVSSLSKRCEVDHKRPRRSIMMKMVEGY